MFFVDFKNDFSEDLISLKDEEMMTKKYAFLAFAFSPKWLVKWLINSQEDFSVTAHCLEALGQESVSRGSYCPVLSHRRRGPAPFVGQTGLQLAGFDSAV